MKKFFLFLLVVVILAVGGALFFVAGNLDDTIHDAIETTGSEMMGEPVEVEAVTLSLTDGSGEITGLTIANPEGYTDPYAFRIQKIRLQIDVASTASSPKRIKEFTLVQPEMYIEVTAEDEVNFEVLATNLENNIPEASPQEAPAEEESPEETLLAIDLLRIEGAKLTLRHPELEGGVKEVVLPDSVVRNVGGETGLTGSELSLMIVEKVTEESLEQALRQEVKKRAGNFLQMGLDSLMGNGDDTEE